MKKILKLLLISVLSLNLIACTKTDNKLEKVVNKKYQGHKQHEIQIFKDRMFFSKYAGFNINNVKDADDIRKYEEERNREYLNPKIVVKDGKEYLTADGFNENLLIVDENTIVDEENNYKYVLVEKLLDKNKK